MCLRAKPSFVELDEVGAPFELTLRILDETGHITSSPFCLSSQIPILAKYIQGQVVSYHNLCKDG